MSKAEELAAWMNEGCWHKVSLGHVEAVGNELLRLAQVERELEALKASIGEPKSIGLEQAQEAGLLDAPYELVGWCAPRPDVVDWKSYEPEVGTPIYVIKDSK